MDEKVMASKCIADLDTQVAINDLPITFKVKYIGYEPSHGLWGIKYTRRPVNIMVDRAKKLTPPNSLPICDLNVAVDGVRLNILPITIIDNSNNNSNNNNNNNNNSNNNNYYDNGKNWYYPIDTISYGVQDLVYTRVFAMIVVNDEHHPHPFDVHGFVCDSRAMARKVTYALAAAFQDYSRRMKDTTNDNISNIPNDRISLTRKKFAIDLRSPEQLADDEVGDETEA